MRTTTTRTTRGSLAVVAAGMATALVAWAVIRLLGVDLTVEAGSGTAQVGAIDVLLASLVAGLADGISAFSLICLHILVAVVLITGFARFIPLPWQVDYRSSRG